jgi:hypothetical protein
MASTYQGVELLTVPNGSDNNVPLISPNRRSPMSHSDQQNRVLKIGGSLWAVSNVVGGVAQFVTDSGSKHQTQTGQMFLVQALLQTIGAMVVAATDADLDLFAKKHPRCVVIYGLWVVLSVFFSALAPPLQVIFQIYWLAALPFAYLLTSVHPGRADP